VLHTEQAELGIYMVIPNHSSFFDWQREVLNKINIVGQLEDAITNHKPVPQCLPHFLFVAYH
jgi:hypothetical protein